MPKPKPTRDHDPNRAVARIVAKTAGIKTAKELMPADAEAAWRAWAASIQKCDERTMTLLHAAFEAGVEAGRRERR